jgi:Ca2+-binding RTX toxin-like protein
MTITVNSNVTTGNSLDFNSYIDNYDGNFAGTNRGWFYGGSTLAGPHSQYGNDSAGDAGASDSLIIGGTFNYTFGTFSGSLNTMSFGTDVNFTGTGNLSTSALTQDSTLFDISGLNITGSTATDQLQKVVLSFLNGTAKTDFHSAFDNDNIVFNGNAGHETFTGGNLADTLNGGAGDDTLNGAGGNDIITGGDGADVLTGGSGVDTFVYASAAHADVDTITDFTSLTDKIDLDWAFTWVSGAASNAGEVSYDASIGALTGFDSGNNYFSIASASTIVQADLV